MHFAIDRHHIIPVRHDILRLLVPVGKDVVDHLSLIVFDHALLETFLHHIDDFFLGDIALLTLVTHAEHKKDSTNRSAHQRRQGTK